MITIITTDGRTFIVPDKPIDEILNESCTEIGYIIDENGDVLYELE